MKPSSPERIQSMVMEMLTQAGVTAPPVDLHAVATARGVINIELLPDTMMRGLMGQVSQDQGGLRIRLNADMPLRQRFTLAHEIAHTLVEPNMGGNRSGLKGSSSHRATERLCDRIASEMLMPTQWFAAATRDRPVSIDTMVWLSKLFDASIQAVAIRLAKQRSNYAEVVCWRLNGDVWSAEWCAGVPRFSRSVTNRNEPSNQASFVGLGQALAAPGSHFTKVVDGRGTPYLMESRSFGTPDYRYVLSLVKPFRSEAELVGAQRVARARARHIEQAF